MFIFLFPKLLPNKYIFPLFKRYQKELLENVLFKTEKCFKTKPEKKIILKKIKAVLEKSFYFGKGPGRHFQPSLQTSQPGAQLAAAALQPFFLPRAKPRRPIFSSSRTGQAAHVPLRLFFSSFLFFVCTELTQCV
jgi:hypothetical protein